MICLKSAYFIDISPMEDSRESFENCIVMICIIHLFRVPPVGISKYDHGYNVDTHQTNINRQHHVGVR